jgi:hypothetical protein
MEGIEAMVEEELKGERRDIGKGKGKERDEDDDDDDDDDDKEEEEEEEEEEEDNEEEEEATAAMAIMVKRRQTSPTEFGTNRRYSRNLNATGYVLDPPCEPCRRRHLPCEEALTGTACISCKRAKRMCQRQGNLEVKRVKGRQLGEREEDSSSDEVATSAAPKQVPEPTRKAPVRAARAKAAAAIHATPSGAKGSEAMAAPLRVGPPRRGGIQRQVGNRGVSQDGK